MSDVERVHVRLSSVEGSRGRLAALLLELDPVESRRVWSIPITDTGAPNTVTDRSRVLRAWVDDQGVVAVARPNGYVVWHRDNIT